MNAKRTWTGKAVRWWAKPLIILSTSASLLLGGVPSPAYADPIWDRWLAAERAVASGNEADAVPHWKFLVEHYASIGDWESAALFSGSLDEYYDKIKQYEEAIHYYELENSYWLKLGKDWGAVDIQRAEQIRTIVEAYISTDKLEAVKKAAAPPAGKLAKYEPEYGVYIGMYSEQEPAIGNFFTRTEGVYGKKHALYLAYSPYSESFPKQYATRAKEAGAALQIAWEPSGGLDEVVDNDHLRSWARAAKATGIPIFLRYASEMNGNWVPWHGDKAKYIEKFRLVHDVMAQEAPNVAMVWSPGDVPVYSMHEYYPGDDYVDWVGVSLYVEPYENGDPNQANMKGTSPVERLDDLYRTYADRKPLMLSEAGVPHYARIADESVTDWALMNLSRLYEVMPHKYPRLKSITFFNVDAVNTLAKNNYLLSSEPAMKKAYTSIISDPYYLSKVETGAKPANQIGYVKLGEPGAGSTFSRKADIRPFVKIPEIDISKLEFAVNGELVATRTTAPYAVQLDAEQVPDNATIELRVYNGAGELAASKSFPLSSQIVVSINGKDQRYEQAPVIIDGSTMTPLRAIFESFGAEVSWNDTTKTATATKGATTVALKIGDKMAYKNGAPIELETPAQLVNGFTMAPARFVGETFGGRVSWESKSRTVQITVSAATLQQFAKPVVSAASAAPASVDQASVVANSTGPILSPFNMSDSKESGFMRMLSSWLVPKVRSFFWLALDFLS
jgi:hypothetical protein